MEATSPTPAVETRPCVPRYVLTTEHRSSKSLSQANNRYHNAAGEVSEREITYTESVAPL